MRFIPDQDRNFRHWILAILGFFLLMSISTLFPERALAGVFEISAGASFSRSVFGDANNYSWTFRWGGSVGYELNEKSQIELAFQETTDRNFIADYEDTSFVDRVYSVNWVQSILGRNAVFQPYLKAGLGQLNRDATGTYGGGSVPITRVDAVTGVLGAGFRLYFTRTIALRGEATSYLTGGVLSTWQDNWGSSLGLSLMF